mmetsp:Transcript_38651/g.111615  ORF Transcript_38651/g.111615 Transcript_38651/m.111615 type:complete len:221 (-) Transcript_38651:572-1234(-)
MLKNVAPHSAAIHFASKVLPVPGGPKSNKPRAGRVSDDMNKCGCKRGKINTSSIWFLTKARPAISLRVTRPSPVARWIVASRAGTILDNCSASAMRNQSSLQVRSPPDPPPGAPVVSAARGRFLPPGGPLLSLPASVVLLPTMDLLTSPNSMGLRLSGLGGAVNAESRNMSEAALKPPPLPGVVAMPCADVLPGAPPIVACRVVEVEARSATLPASATSR